MPAGAGQPRPEPGGGGVSHRPEAGIHDEPVLAVGTHVPQHPIGVQWQIGDHRGPLVHVGVDRLAHVLGMQHAAGRRPARHIVVAMPPTQPGGSDCASAGDLRSELLKCLEEHAEVRVDLD